MRLLEGIHKLISFLFYVFTIAGGITLILININPNIIWQDFVNIYLGVLAIIYGYNDLKQIIQ